ncbi:hypothetical protein ARMGADRAFT_555974 [Armillaria gallica]|uniref:Secreted protein n=1 Tax=Armillaria gallica TaxID=47427 RepID=A0A2H3D209_ARMGA|nr:hypothetical protein ARMGADRAFT_555974 [Armillaria gallica]
MKGQMLGSARCPFLLVVSMTALCTVSLPQTGCNPRVVNSMTSHAPWLMLLCRHILGISEDHCPFIMMLSSSRTLSCVLIGRMPGGDSWVFKHLRCAAHT